VLKKKANSNMKCSLFSLVFFSIIFESGKKPDDKKKKGKSKQISAGLSQAHLHSQANCLQTSYIKQIKVFLFAI